MRILFFGSILMLLVACKSFTNAHSNSKPITHELWDALLKKHVTEEGCVNYQGFQNDSVEFSKYIHLLENHIPNDSHWKRDEQKAYWINAYNAFTVKLILNNYPVKSIKDIGGKIYRVNTAWAIKWIKLEGNDYSLDNIEHDVLRPIYRDPRIHAAVNCASVSCPKLRNFAFTAEQLDEQLDESMKSFLHDKNKNNLHARPVRLSKLFWWYKKDFLHEDKSVVQYINDFITDTIESNHKPQYLDYDWGLNECTVVE